MSTEPIFLTLAMLLGFLLNAWLVWSLFTRPESFWKWHDRGVEARPDLRGQDIYKGWLFFAPFMMLLVFGCRLCWLSYGWASVIWSALAR